MEEYKVGVSFRFAAFCKKVLKLSAYKWYAKRKKHEEKEVSLSLVCEEYEMDFQDPKDYFESRFRFQIYGMDVWMDNDDLAEAVFHLEKKGQDVILLYFFLDFNHEEIASLCQCSVRTVIRRKQAALNLLREELVNRYEETANV